MLASAALLLTGCVGGDGAEPSRASGPGLVMFETTGGDYRLALATLPPGEPDPIVGAASSSPTPELFAATSLSPDGDRIVFAAREGPESIAGGEGADVFVAGVDGESPEQVTDLGDVSQPIWSPTGDRIVFARIRSSRGGLSAALFVTDGEGDDAERLTGHRPGRLDIPGSFTPDGTQLAFTRATLQDGGEFGLEVTNAVNLLDLEDGSVRELIPQASDPAISPDGTKLAYAGEKDRNGQLTYGESLTVAAEIYVARADGSAPRRLTRTNSLNEGAPAWSRDGTRLAYERGEQIDNAEAKSVRQMNADGSCDELVAGTDPRGSWYAAPTWLNADAIGPIEC